MKSLNVVPIILAYTLFLFLSPTYAVNTSCIGFYNKKPLTRESIKNSFFFAIVKTPEDLMNIHGKYGKLTVTSLDGNRKVNNLPLRTIDFWGVPEFGFGQKPFSKEDLSQGLVVKGSFEMFAIYKPTLAGNFTGSQRHTGWYYLSPIMRSLIGDQIEVKVFEEMDANNSGHFRRGFWNVLNHLYNGGKGRLPFVRTQYITGKVISVEETTIEIETSNGTLIQLPLKLTGGGDIIFRPKN